MKNSTESYDLVVLDPPSFIKSRKKLKEGERGYIDLNKKALRRVVPDGHLFTFSCSHNMKRARFRDILRVAAYGSADLYLLRELTQAGDHPDSPHDARNRLSQGVCSQGKEENKMT